MLITMAIPLETVDFNFVQVSGFMALTAMMLISMASTTLGVKWELTGTTETFLLHTQEFTGFHMDSMSGMVEILCHLQK